MKLHQFRGFLIVGFVVMLVVQLTGVSCLADWQLSMASDLPTAVHATGTTADLSGSEGHSDDGCPCHLAFVSVQTGIAQVISPVFLSAVTLPAAPPILRPFTLFRPPLQV